MRTIEILYWHVNSYWSADQDLINGLKKAGFKPSGKRSQPDSRFYLGRDVGLMIKRTGGLIAIQVIDYYEGSLDRWYGETRGKLIQELSKRFLRLEPISNDFFAIMTYANRHEN